MYLVGRIADQTDIASSNGLVEINGATELQSGVPAFLVSLATNHGGAAMDYNVLQVIANNDIERISAGDEFELVWSADDIIGVDFAIEDAKRIVDFVSDKAAINGNGIAEATITITVYESDGTTVAAGVTASKIWPILKNGSTVYTRFTVTNGVGTMIVKRSEGGSFRFPAVNRLDTGSIRVRAVVDIEVLEMFE